MFQKVQSKQNTALTEILPKKEVKPPNVKGIPSSGLLKQFKQLHQSKRLQIFEQLVDNLWKLNIKTIDPVKNEKSVEKLEKLFPLVITQSESKKLSEKNSKRLQKVEYKIKDLVNTIQWVKSITER